MKNLSFALIISLIVSACATATRINGVQLGMTRQQVIAVMGPPASVSAKGHTVYLNYALSETDDQAFYGVTKQYYVRLVDGHVDSFGRTGDFDSTKTPTVRLETNQSVNKNVHVTDTDKLYTKLKKLKELRDSGILTEKEFQEQKEKLLKKY